jgi:peptidoglycan hydrolase-like protein with peptidoglycan-binding domain
MKFSPTITLALALAAGMTGAATAQTAQTPSTSTAQPEATAAQAQPPAMQAQQPAVQAQPSMQTGSTSPAMQPPAADQTAAPSTQAAAQGGASEQVRYAQQQLGAMGLYKGPADGRMDPDTRAALANFQAQHGLRRTSDLDQQTYARLTASQTQTQTQGSGSSTAPNAAAPAGAGGNTGGQAPTR